MYLSIYRATIMCMMVVCTAYLVLCTRYLYPSLLSYNDVLLVVYCLRDAL